MGRFSWIIRGGGNLTTRSSEGKEGAEESEEEGEGGSRDQGGQPLRLDQPLVRTHAAPLPHFELHTSRTVQWCSCGLSASKLVVTGYSSRRNWSTGPHLRNTQLDSLKAGSQVFHLSIPSSPPWDSHELWCSWSPLLLLLLFSYSAMSISLWPHGLQHARPPCPPPSSGVCPGSHPLNWWCCPTILSSTALFFCLQSFPASGSFPMSQLSR